MEIVYKSCYDFIIKMQKLTDTITNEDREIFKTNPLTDRQKASYKTNKMLVIDIYHKFTGEKKDEISESVSKDLKYVYKVGEITESNYGKEEAEFYEWFHYYLEEDRARYNEPLMADCVNYLNGFVKLYDYNGILMDEKNYLNGKLNGECLGYWCDGRIRTRENYLNNEQIGKNIIYLYDGLTMQICDYDDDRSIKIYKKNEDGDWTYNDEETKRYESLI